MQKSSVHEKLSSLLKPKFAKHREPDERKAKERDILIQAVAKKALSKQKKYSEFCRRASLV